MADRMDQWPTGRLLSAVARRIERDWNAHLSHWDLNHASLPVLYLLADGPRSQRHLAQTMGVTEQTMSRVVARLERSAYITRRTHPQDRRRHDVALTEAGWAALAAAGDREVAEEMSVRGLTGTQVAQLRALLTTMLDAHPGVHEVPEEPDRGRPAGSDRRPDPGGTGAAGR